MARKVLTMIKLQIPAGAANPAPPVGPALGQHGVNIMEFCKAFNAQTQQDAGTIIPVEITVFEDRSFTFITKTPPAAVLIKQAIGVAKGSGEPNREKVGHDQPRPGAPDRRDQDARPERKRRRPGDEDHRGNGALDGSGRRCERRLAIMWCPEGARYEARQALPGAARADRPRARVLAGRGDLGRQVAPVREVQRGRRGRTSGSASTSATPTSRCAARW